MPPAAKSEKDDDGGAGKVKTDGAAVDARNAGAGAVKGAEPAKTSAAYNGGEMTVAH